MSSREVVDSGGDVRMREIQASIAEGKMMLHVLKSLPSSENNDSFILRFEELVSRLENYRTQLSDASEASETVPMTSTESVSKCLPTTLPSSSPQSAASSPLIPLAKVENPLNGATPTTSSGASTKVRLPALKKAAYLSIELNKLMSFADDAERFEGMVDRLIDITKRAHLTEATGFLSEIRTRFTELRSSFCSLRETCEAIQSDSLTSDELQDFQVSSLSDFLTKLGSSLESTKECFFTIYHLVKSNIEQGMANGSLQEIDADEDNGAASDTNNKTTVAIGSVSETLSTPTKDDAARTGSSDRDAVSSALDAQKAYLAALQSQTKAERDEIDRLLKQRDQLTERLHTLRAAANNNQRCTNDVANGHVASEPLSVTSSSGSTTDHSNISLLSTFALNRSTVDHLEAKRRELEKLKAQLATLKRAEEKVALLGVSPSPGELSVGHVQSAGDTEVPLDLHFHGGHERRQSLLETEDLIKAFWTQPSNTGVPTVSVSIQATTTKPGASNDLQSSILEDSCRSTRTPTKQISSDSVGTMKPSDECSSCFTDRTPAVANYDRTTFATWGGSSATQSSTTSLLIGAPGEEESIDGANPVSHNTSAGIIPNRSAFSAFNQSIGTDYETGQPNGPLTPRSGTNAIQSSSVVTSGRTSLHQEHSTLSMPQLGTSPSPPADRSMQSQDADDSYHAERFKPSVCQGQSGVDSTFTASVFQGNPQSGDSDTRERVARLENSVSQLYQICRHLVTENSQLNTTVKTLLLSLPRDVHAYGTSHPGNTHTAAAVGPTSLVVHAPQPSADTSQHRVPYPLCSFAETLGDPTSMLQQLLSSSADAKPPQLIHPEDPLLSLLSQLAQQQTQYYQLQMELQRLLLSRAQLTAGVSQYVSNQLAAPDGQIAAALLSAISCTPVGAVHSGGNSTGLINPQTSHGLSSFNSSSGHLIPTTYALSNSAFPLPLVTRPLSAQSFATSTRSTVPSAFGSYAPLTSFVLPTNNPAVPPQSSSSPTGNALSAAVDLLSKIRLPPNSASGQGQL